MSWGLDLWDQYETLASHTLKGIEFLERYSQFVKDRCAIETDYANKLRKLTKTYNLKKKEEDEMQFSSCKAFVQMMSEVNGIAAHHESVAENLNSQVVKEILILVKELRDQRKMHLQEGTKLQANLQASLNQLEKYKKSYEKACKESEKANDNYQKAHADLHLSRMELNKAKANSIAKLQYCEECKSEYSNQLQKTNEAQRQHYTELMPKVFQQFQDMDERRILSIQLFMKQATGVQRQAIPAVGRCLDEMDIAADSIDPKDDSNIVVSRYRSGNPIPGDIPFEEHKVTPIKEEDGGDESPPLFLNKSDTLKGTVSLQKPKKRGGLFSIFNAHKHHGDLKEDYSDLPPHQRKKKLTQKVENLGNQIKQAYATREGALKLKASYEDNPSLGNAEIVDQEIAETDIKIEKLEAQLQKFKGYLDEAEGKSTTPDGVLKNGDNMSLSKNSVDSNILNSGKVVAPAVPLPRNCGTSTNGGGIQNADDQPDYGNSGLAVEFDGEPLPALGKATALYPFDAQSEGSIPMEEGEEFEVVELDQGDGWTRVRRANMEEGFVPTSYIECSLYNNC